MKNFSKLLWFTWEQRTLSVPFRNGTLNDVVTLVQKLIASSKTIQAIGCTIAIAIPVGRKVWHSFININSPSSGLVAVIGSSDAFADDGVEIYVDDQTRTIDLNEGLSNNRSLKTNGFNVNNNGCSALPCGRNDSYVFVSHPILSIHCSNNHCEKRSSCRPAKYDVTKLSWFRIQDSSSNTTPLCFCQRKCWQPKSGYYQYQYAPFGQRKSRW